MKIKHLKILPNEKQKNTVPPNRNEMKIMFRQAKMAFVENKTESITNMFEISEMNKSTL